MTTNFYQYDAKNGLTECLAVWRYKARKSRPSHENPVHSLLNRVFKLRAENQLSPMLVDNYVRMFNHSICVKIPGQLERGSADLETFYPSRIFFAF